MPSIRLEKALLSRSNGNTVETIKRYAVELYIIYSLVAKNKYTERGRARKSKNFARGGILKYSFRNKFCRIQVR